MPPDPLGPFPWPGELSGRSRDAQSVHGPGIVRQNAPLLRLGEILPPPEMLDAFRIFVIPMRPVRRIHQALVAQDLEDLGEKILAGLGMDEHPSALDIGAGLLLAQWSLFGSPFLPFLIH